MGEILPDGSIQGYQNYCSKCGVVINVNAQGSELHPHHDCKPFWCASDGRVAVGNTRCKRQCEDCRKLNPKDK